MRFLQITVKYRASLENILKNLKIYKSEKFRSQVFIRKNSHHVIYSISGYPVLWIDPAVWRSCC